MCQCLFASASPTEFLEPFETNNRFPSTAKTPFSRVSRRNFDNSSFKGIDTGSCQTSCRFAQIDRLRNTRRKTHEGAVTVTRVYRSDDRHDFNIIYSFNFCLTCRRNWMILLIRDHFIKPWYTTLKQKRRLIIIKIFRLLKISIKNVQILSKP